MEELATFLRERTDFLSHGYCPGCSETLLAEYAEEAGVAG